MLHDREFDDNLSKIPRTPFEEALFELFTAAGSPRILKIMSVRAGVVSGVEINLSSFRSIYHQKQDARAVFTQAYEKITETVLFKVQNPNRGFAHRVWLAALDDTFAQYYFEASKAYDAAHNSKSQENNVTELWKDVPELWKMVFDYIGVGESALTFPPRATALEKLILPLFVHMMHDLPLAVAELAVEEAKFLATVAQGQHPDQAIQDAQIDRFDCQEVATLREAGTEIRSFQQYIGDYNRINTMLAEGDYKLIDAVQQTTTTYSPLLLNWFDHLAGRYDEILTHNVIQFIRGKAWYEATRLVEANSLEEGETIRRSIEEDTKVLIKLFHDPSSQFRTALLQCARAVSGLFQTWPEDSPPSADFNPINT